MNKAITLTLRLRDSGAPVSSIDPVLEIPGFDSMNVCLDSGDLLIVGTILGGIGDALNCVRRANSTIPGHLHCQEFTIGNLEKGDASLV